MANTPYALSLSLSLSLLSTLGGLAVNIDDRGWPKDEFIGKEPHFGVLKTLKSRTDGP
jgi:hypothetical protein